MTKTFGFPKEASISAEDAYFTVAAFHEAGHVLAGIAIGGRVDYARIGPYPRCTGRTGLAHSVSLDEIDTTSQAGGQFVRRLIFQSLAGGAAELIGWTAIPPALHPISNQSSTSDIIAAERYALMIAQARSVEAMFHAAREQAKSFLLEPANFSVLVEVAKPLFDNEYLGETEITNIVQRRLVLTALP